ncbi:MAG: AcrR family transcriptional regulator [Oleispira sp.]|jgi:AcrR family transcriptional regulator
MIHLRVKLIGSLMNNTHRTNSKQYEAVPNKQSSGKYAGKEASTRQRERKEKLILAGIKLIGSKGFVSTTVDAVCAEALLTKRYFYESFKNSEELLVEAYRCATREFMSSILAAAAPHRDDSRKLVHAGIRQTFMFVQENPNKARLIMIEAMSVRSQLGRVYGKSYGEFVDLLVAFTKPFLPDNDDSSDAILAVMARGGVGVLLHLSQVWIATDFEQPIDELVIGAESIFRGMGRELSIPGWDGL